MNSGKLHPLDAEGLTRRGRAFGKGNRLAVAMPTSFLLLTDKQSVRYLRLRNGP